MRIGSGSHRYELAENWGTLPEGVSYGYTHGVAVDQEDNVYIHNTSKNAVIVFDRSGRFLNSWGADFAAGAHGMFLAREGAREFLFLADTARRQVFKTTLSGEVLLSLGAPDLPGVYDAPETYAPTDVAVAPNGDFYVVDGYGQSWIHQYSPAGSHIRSWGGKGAEPGQLSCPHGAWVDTRGAEPLLYVADRANNRIQIFTLDGRHVRFVTDDIDYPCCFYQFGDELVIPDLHSRVSILDKSDRLILHLGEDQEAWRKEGWPNRPVSEWDPGKFVSPHAACLDSRGDLYVVEWTSVGRVTKWVRV